MNIFLKLSSCSLLLRRMASLAMKSYHNILHENIKTSRLPDKGVVGNVSVVAKKIMGLEYLGNISICKSDVL
jgi:hypothetical protein